MNTRRSLLLSTLFISVLSAIQLQAANFNSLDSYTSEKYNNPLFNPANVFTYRDLQYGFTLKFDLGVSSDTTDLNSFSSIEETLSQFDGNASLDTARELTNDYNAIVEDASSQLQYSSISGDVNSPIAFFWRIGGFGYVSVGQSFDFETRAQVFVGPIRINPLQQAPESATYPYISHSEKRQLYWNHGLQIVNNHLLEVAVGYRGKISTYKLHHEVLYYDIVSSDRDALDANLSSYTKQIYDNIAGQDEINFDVGIHVEMKHISGGMQIIDLRRNVLDFNTLGDDCLSLVGYAQDTCWVNRSFSDRIELNRTLVLEPKAVLNINLHDSRKTYKLALAAESESYNSLNIREQWVFASLYMSFRPFYKTSVKVNLHYAANIANKDPTVTGLNQILIEEELQGISIEIFNTLEIIYSKSKSSISESVILGDEIDYIPNFIWNQGSVPTNNYFGIKLEIKF